MIEIIPSHKMRIAVYISLSILTIASCFSVFFVMQTYQIATANRSIIEKLDDRLIKRENVAKEYIPRLERLEQMYIMHEAILQGVMSRQKEITSDYLKILKGR